MGSWEWIEATMAGALVAVRVLLFLFTLAIGVFCVRLELWYVRRIIARWKRLRHAGRGWPHAEGRLVGHAGLRTSAGEVPIVSYTFVVEGVTHRGADDAAVLRKLPPGDAVDVVYDPEDPGFNNFIAHGAFGRAVGWLIFAVIVALLLAAVSVLSLWFAVDLWI